MGAFFVVGNLHNRCCWHRNINLMENFQVTCGSEVVICKHPLQTNSGRTVLGSFVSFSSLNGFIKKMGLLFDRYDTCMLLSEYVQDNFN